MTATGCSQWADCTIRINREDDKRDCLIGDFGELGEAVQIDARRWMRGGVAVPLADVSDVLVGGLLPVLVEDALGSLVVPAVVVPTGALVENGQDVGDYNGVAVVPADEDAAGFAGKGCQSQIGAVNESRRGELEPGRDGLVIGSH
ncbi:hypothetical protein ASD81_15860 [Nocardioides sp. Root614]|nr:hypothetical protein ASD81_15860 [Nocardioides sp. Root614]KRA87595.1 hypothetical protein ASD84_16135 [Nocardioides sp. Root682]